MTKHTVSGPQGMIAVESAGDPRSVLAGTPIIFIHSDLGNRDQWRGTMAHVADERCPIAFDRRGHGESDTPRNGDYSVENSTQDVIAVANDLGVDRFVMVGHSGGGAIAFACAALHPDRVEALLLVDPSPDPSALPPGLLQSQLATLQGKDYDKTIVEYYASQAGPDQALKDRIVATARAAPKETGIGTLQAFIEFRPQSYAGRYTGPALAIIQSQFDMPGALHRIGGFEHRSIDGVGHWLQLGAPEKFYGMLDEFLEKAESDLTTLPRVRVGPPAHSSTR